MIVSPSDISHSELYGILLNSVAPRPIAWVSTISGSGQRQSRAFFLFQLCLRRPSVAGLCAGTAAIEASAIQPWRAKRYAPECSRDAGIRGQYRYLRTSRGYEFDQRRIRCVCERVRISESHSRAIENRAPAKSCRISSKLRMQTPSDCRLFSRPYQQQLSDRPNRFDSHQRRAFERRTPGSQFVGPHRPHGRDAVHKDDTKI